MTASRHRPATRVGRLLAKKAARSLTSESPPPPDIAAYLAACDQCVIDLPDLAPLCVKKDSVPFLVRVRRSSPVSSSVRLTLAAVPAIHAGPMPSLAG